MEHEGDRHCVIILDEGYQVIDTRRSMAKSALALTDEITQTRKSGVLTILTGVSVDWIDKRIRGQARTIYNCWSPDPFGRYVCAQVHQVSTGHLPPWQRDKVKPRLMWWDTSESRKYYNTKERIDQRDEATNALNTKSIMVTNEVTGEVEVVEMGELVNEELLKLVKQGEGLAKPEDIANTLKG